MTSPFTHPGLTNGKTYFFVVTASNSAGESPESAEVSGTPWQAGLLQGPPGDPANSHIPDIPISDPPPEDIVEPDGITISVRDLLVIFADEATVEQVNTLVQSLPSIIVGGNSLGKMLLLRLTGSSDLERLLEAWRILLTDPLVRAASINYALSPASLPPHNVDTTNNRWTWEMPPALASGNWGLKAIRAPQVWNLYDHSSRLNAAIEALVLEVSERPGANANAADSNHPDLNPRVNVLANSLPSNHATMVAGIISATWDNNSGVEGVYPRNLTIISRRALFTGTLESDVVQTLQNRPRVHIINYSAGELIPNIDPVNQPLNPNLPVQNNPNQPNFNPTWRVIINFDGNRFLTFIQNYLGGPGSRSDWLMFCAAGNNRLRPGTNQDFEARDTSNCANVAARGVNPDPNFPLPGQGAGADHFLSVESMDAGGSRAFTSASAGTISAPGDCVRSTELNDGNNYDGPCAGDDANDPNYATASGTSFATPFAAGLAAYLWSLAPNRSYTDVRRALADPVNRVRVGAGPRGGAAGSERIDAFSAAMGIDVIQGNKNLQRALVDVDDGTPDGNLRFRVFPDDPDPDAVHTQDQRRGNGQGPTMWDFRAFRDGWLQVNNVTPRLMDGPATHFKWDFNFDGCVGNQPANPAHAGGTVPVPPAGCANAPQENVYPLYDFNGDGRITANASNPGAGDVAPFKIDPDIQCAGLNQPQRGCFRDIDVIGDGNSSSLQNDGIWGTGTAPGAELQRRLDVTEQVFVPNRDEANINAADEGGTGLDCKLDEHNALPPVRTPNDRWGRTNLLSDRDGDGSVDYLNSADFHLRFFSFQQPQDFTIHEFRILSPPGAGRFFTKQRGFPQGFLTGRDYLDEMVTVPLFGAGRDAEIRVCMSQPGEEILLKDLRVNLRGLRCGEDLAMRLAWHSVSVPVTPATGFRVWSTGRDDPALFPKEQQTLRWWFNPVVREADTEKAACQAVKTALDALENRNQNASELIPWLGNHIIESYNIQDCPAPDNRYRASSRSLLLRGRNPIEQPIDPCILYDDGGFPQQAEEEPCPEEPPPTPTFDIYRVIREGDPKPLPDEGTFTYVMIGGPSKFLDDAGRVLFGEIGWRVGHPEALAGIYYRFASGAIVKVTDIHTVACPPNDPQRGGEMVPQFGILTRAGWITYFGKVFGYGPVPEYCEYIFDENGTVLHSVYLGGYLTTYRASNAGIATLSLQPSETLSLNGAVIVSVGDETPLGPLVEFSYGRYMDMNNLGDIAFAARGEGQAWPGLLLYQNGRISKIVAPGDILSTGERVESVSRVSINDNGQVAFACRLYDFQVGASTNYVCLYSGETVRWVTPNYGSGLAINDNGEIAVALSGTGGIWLLIPDPEGFKGYNMVEIAGNGDPAPGGGSFVFYPDYGYRVDINNEGWIAFEASVDTGGTGVYLAVPR